MFEIAKRALGFDALPMVIEENNESTACSHIELACGGHHSGYKAEDVTRQDKKPDSCYQGEVFLSPFSDDINQEAFECLDNEFENTLEL